MTRVVLQWKVNCEEVVLSELQRRLSDREVIVL